MSGSGWWTSLYVAGFIAAQTGSALLFRYASQKEGRWALLYFILGNAVGFSCTICLTMALKNQNPNVVYAFCFGLGFCVLQLASFLLFRVPLTGGQWAGISLMAMGMILLASQGAK